VAVLWVLHREGESRYIHNEAARGSLNGLFWPRGKRQTSFNEALWSQAERIQITVLVSVAEGTRFGLGAGREGREMSIAASLTSVHWDYRKDQPHRHPVSRAFVADALTSLRVAMGACSWSTQP